MGTKLPGTGLTRPVTTIRPELMLGRLSTGLMRKEILTSLARFVMVAVLWPLAPAAPAGRAADATALLNEAHQQRKTGNYLQAIDTYERVLQLPPSSRNVDQEWVARTFLALTHKLAGNPRRSLELNEQTLAFVRKHIPELVSDPINRELDSIQAIAADHVSLGNLAKAVELLKQALAIESRTDTNRLSLGKGKFLQKLGIVQFLSNDLNEAEKTLSASMQAFESSQRKRIASGMPAAGEYEMEVEVMRWLQKILVIQQRTDEALEIAEKGRARGFAGLLANRLGAAPNPALEDSLTLARMKAIAAAERSTIVEYSVLYRYDPNLPLEFSDFRIAATDILIWIIDPNGRIAFRQVKLEPPLLLADLVASSRESIGARGRGVAMGERPADKAGAQPAMDKELQRLHQLLIQPIDDLLPANPDARITFVPQDLLFLVPFAALQDGSGKFMVERHTLAMAPSIQVLGLTRAQQQRLPTSTPHALIVGNPTMPTLGGYALPNLPGAEQEAKAVAALLKAPVLTGAEATKQAVVSKMPEARLIHLATHGLLDDVGGYFSAVALAPGNYDSGLLTSRELLALKLNAELVILSACNTGQGKITGDGVVGLSRSLIAAGASSVIVSLWSVPDSPTTSLMTSFYRALAAGADKSQALRQAMLATMKAYPAPLDWGAFTLIGDTEVSKPLKAGIVRGMGDARDGGTAPAAPNRYRTFPVPEDVEHYREWPSSSGSEIKISFDTSQNLEQLMSFYRRSFAQEGLKEDKTLSRKETKSFLLVFRGSANGKNVVVHGSDMNESGATLTSVSVGFD